MDRPIPPLKRRWLRLLRWPAIVLASLVIGIPTLQAFILRFRVLSAVRSAQSVRLEEIGGGDMELLNAVELSPEQRKEVASAMPLLPDVGTFGMFKLCFVPRHQIVARGPAGQDFVFQVCFECDQVRVQEGLIFGTPVFWRSPLRRLFTEHKIPVRD